MVSALYAVLSALLLMKFSFDVVRLRMQYRVAYGDGGFSELQSAIRIHGNAVEYIPIAIVLMLFMEMNGAETWMVHICGIVLLQRFCNDGLMPGKMSMRSFPICVHTWAMRISGTRYTTYISCRTIFCPPKA